MRGKLLSLSETFALEYHLCVWNCFTALQIFSAYEEKLCKIISTLNNWQFLRKQPYLYQDTVLDVMRMCTTQCCHLSARYELFGICWHNSTRSSVPYIRRVLILSSSDPVGDIMVKWSRLQSFMEFISLSTKWPFCWSLVCVPSVGHSSPFCVNTYACAYQIRFA